MGRGKLWMAVILLGLIAMALFWKSTPKNPDSPTTAAHLPELETSITSRVSVESPKAEKSSAWSPDVEKKLVTLTEILESGSDNDLRMDQELKVLNEETRRAFREKYRQIPSQKRNQRGTIIFLLGRNLKTTEDYDFFKSVMLETPCEGLESCDRTLAPTDLQDSDHQAGAIAILLNYPQMNVLKALQNHPANDETLRLAEEEVLKSGQHFKARVVSELADRLLAARSR